MTGSLVFCHWGSWNPRLREEAWSQGSCVRVWCGRGFCLRGFGSLGWCVLGYVPRAFFLRPAVASVLLVFCCQEYDVLVIHHRASVHQAPLQQAS